MKNRIGYFEVFNGCAGDMLCAGLVDAGLDITLLKKELKKIPLSNYSIKIQNVKRELYHHHFMPATKFLVVLKKEEKFRKYGEIKELIKKSNLSESTKKKILKIFDIIAKAEAKVHREKIENVHFHQVGQTDAIIEVASVVIGLELLGIKKVYSSSVGISKPAPATLQIMKNIPVLIKNSPYEITTPTGISILKGLCEFKSMDEEILIEGSGYGAGEREKPSPNVLKFIYGKEKEEEYIYVVETNIDDMNPLLFENLYEKLFENGAVDVSVFTGIGKKNRPVFFLKVLVKENSLEKIKEIIFLETTTIGIRYRKEKRDILERKTEFVKTKWGKVRIKLSFSGNKIYNVSPEYDDCKKIAREHKVPLKKVMLEVNNLAKKAYL